MNKKTLRIAGWAFGLSMAVAGIGAAVYSQPTKSQTIMVNADGTDVTTALTSSDSTPAWSNSGSTHLKVTLTNHGGDNAPKYNGSNVQLYAQNSIKFEKNPSFAGTVSISSIVVHGKSSKSGKTQTTYYKADGTLATSSGSGVSTITYTTTTYANKTYTFSNVSSAYIYNAGGNQVLADSYTVTYSYTDPKTISTLEIKTEPKTVYYAGDKFDPSGLVITANYSDSTSEDITYAGNEAKFTFAPSLDTTLKEGDDKVTITYGGESVDLDITTNAARSITGIAFYGDMSNKEYVLGDDWDYSGLQLKFTWDAGDPTYVELSDAIDAVDVEITATPSKPASDTTTVTLGISDHLYDFDGAISEKLITGISVLSSYEKVTNLSDVTVGDSYVIGVAGEKKLMGAKSGSVRSIISAETEMNDAKTEVSASLPSGAVVLTVLQGSASNKFYVYDITNDKYLQGSDSGTNLNDASTLNSATQYTFTYSDEVLSMALTSRVLAYNYNNGTDRFGSYIGYGTYLNPVLFKASGSAVKKSVQSFANTYLKMNDTNYDGDISTSNCATNYSTLKTEYAKLSDAEKNVLEYSSDFAGASARMRKWAIANGETFVYGEDTPFAAATINMFAGVSGGTNDGLPLILPIVSVGVLTAGGFFFLARKRRNED